MTHTRLIRNLEVPTFFYGTAWKEGATEGLVLDALRAGFRGIDTANQRKHYYEEGVGRALARCGVPRAELFLQTKFTFRRGQDHRLPYDEDAPIGVQVQQSFQSSLEHLGVHYLDSLVLHGPMQAEGWVREDREAWQAMEAIHDARGTKLLGVSNVSAEQLRALLRVARVAPAFVQNRCYASRGWDAEVRVICDANDVVYQGFSLLTANRQVLAHPSVISIAERHARTPAQVVFRFALHLGVLPLTGTTNDAHMRQDLESSGFELSPKELDLVRAAGG